MAPLYLFLRDNTPTVRAQELCESGGGSPGLPVPNKPGGFCRHKVTLNQTNKKRKTIIEELTLQLIGSICQ